MLLLAAITFGLLSWQGRNQSTVVIEWSTSSELDTAGFNLYRIGTSGQRELVNKNLVPASPDALIGGDYSVEDMEVEPGQNYHYELEEVEINGRTTIHGPIDIRAKPGGKYELILTLIFSLLFIIGIVILFIETRKKIHRQYIAD